MIKEVPETLKNYDMYYAFKPLAENGYQNINVLDIKNDNWEFYIEGIINVMKDSIFTDWAHEIKIYYTFDNVTIPLSIPDSFFNIALWYMIIATDRHIEPKHIFFPENITQKEIKKWTDKNFIDINRKILDNRTINNIIDNSLFQLTRIDSFSMYLSNTVNLEDFVLLMNRSPRFYEALHPDMSNIPIEDTKDFIGKYLDVAVDEMAHSKDKLGYDFCLADSLRAQQGINLKQLREFCIGIGIKPDGNGGIYPMVIYNSFINGGLTGAGDLFMESSVGRISQIIEKSNVRDSGHTARILGINNMDSFINPDPHSDCYTKNYEEIVVKNKKYLSLLRDRYYRLNPDGMEYRISEDNTFLIGQKIYLRSPITCASASRGEGYCYRCYGDLAYTMKQINVGKMSAEEISKILTQRMLSAKHILESKPIKIDWVDEFKEWFDNDSNYIKLSDESYKKNQFMIINLEDICSQEEDDYRRTSEDFEEVYNSYITSFIIKDGINEINIYSKGYDKLYISGELNTIINNNSFIDDLDNNRVIIPLNYLVNINLFYILIQNNELSKTLDLFIETINKSAIVNSMDKNTWLQSLLDVNIEGDLNVMAIHCETILSNQIRSREDVLELPNWENPNEPYKLLTLNQALMSNPSVTITLNFERLAKTLYNPLTYRKTKPSVMDLFMHTNPQKYISVDLGKE